MTPSRRPIRVGEARGYAWGDIPRDVMGRLPAWLAERRVPEGEDLKAGRVFRYGSWAVKFTPPQSGWRRWMRRGPAFRSAFANEALAPIPTPRPLLALEWPAEGGGRHGLLVSQFVDGRFIEEVWRQSSAAMEAFVAFLADMHARRVFHGDFHWHNAIWDGERWYLIDLESLRHPLRTLFPRRLVIDQWARIDFCLALPDGLEPHVARYVELSGRGWDPREVWRDVRERSKQHVADWGEPPKQPD